MHYSSRSICQCHKKKGLLKVNSCLEKVLFQDKIVHWFFSMWVPILFHQIRTFLKVSNIFHMILVNLTMFVYLSSTLWFKWHGTWLLIHTMIAMLLNNFQHSHQYILLDMFKIRWNCEMCPAHVYTEQWFLQTHKLWSTNRFLWCNKFSWYFTYALFPREIATRVVWQLTIYWRNVLEAGENSKIFYDFQWNYIKMHWS